MFPSPSSVELVKKSIHPNPGDSVTLQKCRKCVRYLPGGAGSWPVCRRTQSELTSSNSTMGLG